MTNPLNQSQLRRWHSLRLKLCLSCPIIAPALAALQFFPMSGGTGTRLGPVDARGRVFLDLSWSAQRSDGEIAFAQLHETLHLLLRHYDRRHNRHPVLWNISADFVINDVVHNLGDDGLKPVRVEAALWRERDVPDMPEGLSTEDVYAYLLKNATRIDAPGTIGAGCGVTAASAKNKKPGDAGDSAGNALTEEQWQALADAVAKMGQNDSSLASLFRRPVRPVSWASLVRRTVSSTASRASTTTTWTKIDRRSPPGIICPGRTGGARRIAVAIDKSGSMSDEDVAVAIAQTVAVAKAAGIAVFVVVHDDSVHTAVWIKPRVQAVEIAKLIKSRGGTLFAPAYDVVAAQQGRFDAFIHFTDGAPCDPWPARPKNCKQAIAALTPCGAPAPAGWRTVVVAPPG